MTWHIGCIGMQNQVVRRVQLVRMHSARYSDNTKRNGRSSRDRTDLQEALCGGALDTGDSVQRLPVRLPPPDVGQHIVTGLQPLHQQPVVGQRRQRRRALHLRSPKTLRLLR